MARLDRARPRRPLIVPAVLGGTRLYLPSTGTAPVSPLFDVNWEDTGSASPARRPLPSAPSGSAMTTLNFMDVDMTDRDILMAQHVSPPLAGDQTITAQAIKLAIRAAEVLTSQDMFVAWMVKVVNGTGLIDRGTLVTIRRDDVELATTLTNRLIEATSSQVDGLNGDRIVLEYGVGGDPLVSHDSSLRVGDAAGSDLPYDDTTTTDLNPFIQFAQNLIFGAEAGIKLIWEVSVGGTGTGQTGEGGYYQEVGLTQ